MSSNSEFSTRPPRIIPRSYEPDARVMWTDIASAGYVVIVATAFYPGVFTADSVLTIWQATGEVPTSNWHPTTVIGLWGSLLLVLDAAGLWLLQVSMFGVALALLLRRLSTLSARVVGLLGAFTPPILASLAPLWKDTQLAIVYFALVVLVLTHGTHRPKRNVGLAALLTVLLIGLRFNSFPLALAFAALLSKQLGVRHRLKAAYVLPTSLGIILAAVVIHVVVPRIFVQRQLSPVSTTLAWDLAGIAVRSDVTTVLAGSATPTCTQQMIEAQYTPRTSDPLVFEADACFDITLPEEYEEQSSLIESAEAARSIELTAWLSAVRRHPLEYIAHRAAVMRELLGLGGPSVGALPDNAPSASTVADLDDHPWSSGLPRAVAWLYNRAGWMWDAWIPVLVLALLAVVARLRNHWDVTAVAVATAAYLLMAGIVSPAADLRYASPVFMGTLGVSAVSVDRIFRATEQGDPKDR